MQPIAWPLDLPPGLWFRLEDAEAVAPPGSGWEGGLQQLDRGRLGYHGWKVRLPGAYIWWHSYGGRVLARWHYRGGSVCLLLPLFGEGPMKYQGAALERGSLVWLHPGREHACVTSKNTRGIELCLAPEVVAAWARPPEPKAVTRLDPGHVARLVDTCRRITRAATRDPRGLSTPRGLALRRHLSTAVRRALDADRDGRMSSFRPNGTPAYRIVQRACRHMLANASASEVDVPELAHALGIGERTLYKAFGDWLGVPPYEFQRIQRLHTFRKVLYEATGRRGRIRAAGRAAGLPEAGRLAQIYRRHFQETPRATLQRWSREGSAFDAWPG